MSARAAVVGVVQVVSRSSVLPAIDKGTSCSPFPCKQRDCRYSRQAAFGGFVLFPPRSGD